MVKSRTISKSKTPMASMDYARLRQEGINYIQKISGTIWTNYNLSDPGVTILELLCYAITDLGYRTSFNIKDLLAEETDEVAHKNQFFTAAEILPNNPTTINDYRKLLIDVPGIRNAWLKPIYDSEMAIFADKKNNKLTYDKTELPVLLNGLYKVLLEFEEDRQLGDLNDATIERVIIINRDPWKNARVKIEIEFEQWDALLSHTDRSWLSSSVEKIEVTLTFNQPKEKFDGVVKLSCTSDDKTIEVELRIGLRILSNDREVPLDGAIVDDFVKDLSSLDSSGPIAMYQRRIAMILTIITAVKTTLHAHRNLCEDFIRVESPKVEEIVLCADMELTTDADVEEVLAEIFFKISNHIAPVVNFYSLDELLDKYKEKNKSIDEIFEGPLLNHGFIDDDDLELTDRREFLYVSDMINIMMDIPGVVAVKNIKIASVFQDADGVTHTKENNWSIGLEHEDNYVPRFNMDRSKFIFFKGQVPYTANRIEVQDILTKKKRLQRTSKLSAPVLDREVPEGNYMEVDQYTSIQNEFPLTYGIGESGLPDSATELRKAQAKQLKAYLLFFDQIMANYLAQLAHVKDLFSMSESIKATYFVQYLNDVPNASELYSASPEELLDFLKVITEDEKTFEQRRNKFLDHLMGRFCEQFTDYALIMYRLDQKKAPAELIEDKLALLQNYPEISRDRGKAFNFRDAKEYWNTSNVSGMEKRVSRLLGINQYKRQFLTGDPDRFFERYKDKQKKWRFRVRMSTGDKVIIKSEGYNSAQGRDNGIQSVITNFRDRSNYELKTSRDGKFYFNLVAPNHEIIATSERFATKIKRQEIIDMLISMLKGGGVQEGFHLVEHLLLRPKTAHDHFLPVYFDEECGGCPGSEDPYSFRISIFLPYWPHRFRNLNFRNFFEKTLRMESPAHIYAKICWINEEDMNEFEVAYKTWLQENAKPPETQNKNRLTSRLNKLISVMNKVRTIYPVATLHDCDESSDDTAPVVLDKTILGTFKPE